MSVRGGNEPWQVYPYAIRGSRLSWTGIPLRRPGSCISVYQNVEKTNRTLKYVFSSNAMNNNSEYVKRVTFLLCLNKLCVRCIIKPCEEFLPCFMDQNYCKGKYCWDSWENTLVLNKYLNVSFCGFSWRDVFSSTHKISFTLLLTMFFFVIWCRCK